MQDGFPLPGKHKETLSAYEGAAETLKDNNTGTQTCSQAKQIDVKADKITRVGLWIFTPHL